MSEHTIQHLYRENAKLREENRRLRELASLTYRDGFASGCLVRLQSEWGIHWNASTAKQRLEQIEKGEG